MTELSECKKGNHRLIEIQEAKIDAYDTYAVVRWCEICGAIVVDTDYDNRTKPGDIIKMRIPMAVREL